MAQHSRTVEALPTHPLTRADWVLDPEVRHLNHGSFGAVPRVVLESQRELQREMESDPDRWFRLLPERMVRARTEMAGFLRVPVDTLALVANASAGTSTVMSGLTDLGPGREILLTDHTYGAVVMGAERIAARTGATVRTLHLPLDATAEEIIGRFAEAIGPATALVIVDQITSPTARLLPVGEISRIARAAGVPVLVDGAHAPGMMADPVAEADADYWVGNLHKWPCTPRGTAVLVATGERAQQLHPLIDSWGAPDPYPLRFDMQGTGDVTGWLAAPESLAFIERTCGWDTARAEMTKLADAAQTLLADALDTDLTPVLLNQAPALRLVPLPPSAKHIPDADLKHRIADELGCWTAITNFDGQKFLRLSAHLYNTMDDYTHLAEQLPGLLRRL